LARVVGGLDNKYGVVHRCEIHPKAGFLDLEKTLRRIKAAIEEELKVVADYIAPAVPSREDFAFLPVEKPGPGEPKVKKFLLSRQHEDGTVRVGDATANLMESIKTFCCGTAGICR